ATPALLLTCLLAALPPFHLARLVEGGPAHTGFADLPLAAWLAGAALLLWAGSPRDRGGGVGRLRNAGALGVLAGLMAMTKPEGAVMLIAVLAGLVMSAGPLKAQRRRPILKAAGVALALCLPRLLLILLVPASGAVGYSGDEAYLARLTPAGLATGLRINFLPAAASLLAAPFTLHWALVGLLPLTGFLAGKTTGTRGRHLLLPLLLLPLGADLLAFTVTGSGIVWHLSVALDRLWLQVVPILLMVAAGQWSRLASLDGQRAAGDQPGR
ncbi:MAG: hypothetical protein ACE5ID_06275, partial [Acidobacteriota bacterium]